MNEQQENITTGKVQDIDEAKDLAALMRDPKWITYKVYMERVQKAAFQKFMRRIGVDPETRGYYMGIWNVMEDLIHLPETLSTIIFTQEKNPKGRYETLEE